MKRVTYLVVLMFFGFLSNASAQKQWIGINSSTPTASEVRLVHSNIQHTELQFSLEGFHEGLLTTPKGKEAFISMINGVQIMETGTPDLAKKTVSIIIPDIDEMEISVVSSKYQEFTDISVAPSKGHFDRNIRPDEVPFVYGEVYDTDAFWPGKIASLQDPFVMRDFRGQSIDIYPFQYNPITRTLRVYTDIVIEVSATGKEGLDPLLRTRDLITLEPEFNAIYNRFFLNMGAAERTYPMLEGEEGSMLIIAYDAFMEPMEEFLNWKRTLGRRTELVPKSEAGATAAAIKTFVQNYYNDNEDFAYLLLIGDGPQIPPMTTSWGHSDNAYGFLVGANSYNDIFVGRFSAENVAHVETHVQRMIEYERDLDETDTWMSTAMGVARNEGTGSGHHGEGDHTHMDFIKDTLLNFTYDVVHRNYDGNVPGLPNTTAAQISANINAGVSAINFCNHGSVTGWSVAGYNITHVNQLTNVGKLPYITSVACVNGNFVNNFCFAEAWMRATHNGEPTGAVGIMAGTINQPWQPPMCGQDEMVSIKTEASIPHGPTIKRTYGGISANGSMFMIPQYGAQGIRTHETWILFGDPTLMVRTATPEPFSPAYNPVVFLGTDFFDITVPDAEGATVAITMYDEIEEEVIILGTAIVEDGTANITFTEPPAEPGMLTLAISGFNKVTYINEEIQLIPPEGPFVVFDAYVLDDSDGNNNNQADYGELISLDLSLKNVGIEPAEGVEATLTTDSEHVTIIDNHQVFGTIDEDSNMMVENAFSFQVNEVIPDNHNVMFTLQIEAEDQEGWSSNFALRIYSPVFEIGEFFVDDSEHGDDNGRLDPGETAEIVVRYTNNGGAPAMAPITHFSGSSPYLTILETEMEHDIIPAGEYIDVAYTVEAHSSTVPGTFVDVLFAIEDNHLVESDQILVIGQVPETTIGEGTDIPAQYPFYNYYKANRSQMLYHASELGEGDKIITEMGMEVVHITGTSQHQVFPNFVVRVKHTEMNALGSAFVDMSDATVVFQEDNHQMPLEVGWHIWDIENFEYDGTSNLIIEVVWGLLDTWCSFGDHYRVNGTTKNQTRAVFGRSDTQAIPPYFGNSNILPNLFLAFAAEETEDAKEVEFIIKDIEDNPLENATVTIGSMTMFTDDTGTTSLTLLPGTYNFSTYKEEYIPAEGQIIIEDDDLTVIIILELELQLFEVVFNVDISRAIEFDLLNGFDPQNHHIFITGSMLEWVEPGSEPNHQQMDQAGTDPMTFTITHQLEAGTYEYKYFSDLIGAGWDGGEWEGGENRILEVEDHMIVQDVFGPDELSLPAISAPNVTLYPNPANKAVNIISNATISFVRIVDMKGQTVYSSSADHSEVSIDISSLINGIYFVQIMTYEGAVTHKLQIMK